MPGLNGRLRLLHCGIRLQAERQQRAGSDGYAQTDAPDYVAPHQSASSIRFGQVPLGAHSRSALTRALASSINFRIIAVRATFCGLP